nr:HEAT repeat domain-containing protein [Streptomyces qaidamensis]
MRESAQPDPERRAAALKGLGRIGRAEHARVLAGAADHPDPAVRAAAALGLGRLGVPEAGEEALPLLMGDADPGVRRRASVAVTRLGLGGPAVTRAFACLLSDPDHLERWTEAGGSLPPPTARRPAAGWRLSSRTLATPAPGRRPARRRTGHRPAVSRSARKTLAPAIFVHVRSCAVCRPPARYTLDPCAW